MSDEELRRLEREIALAPHAIELRRQHSILLQRSGREDDSLAALDLAWRLGADDLWNELQDRLAERMITAHELTLCFVPGGPFVMGSEELDDDCAPVHVVELSPFWIAEQPLSRMSLRGTQYFPHWAEDPRWADSPYVRSPAVMTWELARGAIEVLEKRGPPPGLTGRWSLPTEAQWERVFRAAYLRPEGKSPYGPERTTPRVEWTNDRYDPAYYASAPRRDPPGPAEGELIVVRGMPGLPDPEWALYREAATQEGMFEVGERATRSGRGGPHRVGHEEGITLRPVFHPS